MERSHTNSARQRASRSSTRWLLSCLALVIAGSFIPLRWKVLLGAHGPYHLGAHFWIFLLVGFLACVPVNTLTARFVRVAGLFLLAILIEAVQSVVFGDQFETADLRADGLGLTAAVAATQILDLWRDVIQRGRARD